MALRFKIPGEVPDVRPREGLPVVAASRAPFEFEFRQGADLKKKLVQCAEYPVVRVVAAVGAGKSTRMPGELARARGKPVLYVVPSPFLAWDQYEYAKSGVTGFSAEEVHWAGDDAVGIASRGVTYVSGAQLIGMWLRGFDMTTVGGLAVFLDEAHESDACTYVVRHLALSKGASQLVLASATFSASDFPMRETRGQVREVKLESFPPDSPGWCPEEPGEPWSVSSIRHSALFFADNSVVRRKILESYRVLGLDVYELTSRMSLRDYRYAMRSLRDPRGTNLVVVVADSSFRCGFNFPCDVAVDSGSVGFGMIEGGRFVRRARPLYAAELVQSMGRFARGDSGAVYCRPDVEPDLVMCNLEGVELEAAAYLMRVLGFAPYYRLRAAVFATRELPVGVSLAAALSSEYPLVLQLSKAVRAASPSRESPVVEGELLDPRYIEDVGAKKVKKKKNVEVEFEDVAGEVTGLKEKGTFGRGLSGVGALVTGLDAILSDPEEVTVLEPDSCYTLKGYGVVDRCSSMFPQGLYSVKHFAAQRDFAAQVVRLPRAELAVALGCCLSRHNSMVIELLGTQDAVLKVGQELSLGRADLLEVRAWAREKHEHVASIVREMDAVAGIARVIAVGRFTLVRHEPDVARRAEACAAARYEGPEVGEDVEPTFDDTHAVASLVSPTFRLDRGVVSPGSSVSQQVTPYAQRQVEMPSGGWYPMGMYQCQVLGDPGGGGAGVYSPRHIDRGGYVSRNVTYGRPGSSSSSSTLSSGGRSVVSVERGRSGNMRFVARAAASVLSRA